MKKIAIGVLMMLATMALPAEQEHEFPFLNWTLGYTFIEKYDEYLRYAVTKNTNEEEIGHDVYLGMRCDSSEKLMPIIFSPEDDFRWDISSSKFMYVRWDDSPPVRVYWDISDNLAYISPGIRADSFITSLDESGFARIWINVAGLDEEQIARFNVTNFGVATKWCGDWLATPDER